MACHKPGEKRANAAPQSGGEAFLARRFGSAPALFVRTGRESLSSFACSIRPSRSISNHRLAELLCIGMEAMASSVRLPATYRAIMTSAFRQMQGTCTHSRLSIYRHLDYSSAKTPAGLFDWGSEVNTASPLTGSAAVRAGFRCTGRRRHHCWRTRADGIRLRRVQTCLAIGGYVRFQTDFGRGEFDRSD